MTSVEHAAFVASHRGRGATPAGTIVVAESREHPVRMKRRLPSRWLGSPAAPAIAAAVRPGENFTFQIVVLNNVTAAAAELEGPGAAAFCAPQDSGANSPWHVCFP